MVYKRKADIKATGDWRGNAPSAETTIGATGTKAVMGVSQTIGTTAEALGQGDITNSRCLMVRNLDLTNYVELSLDAGTTYIAKIRPGEEHGPHLLPDSQSAVHMRANTGPVEVLYTLISSS